MHDAPAILDPRHADLVHRDVTCEHLWALAARVEAASGRPVDGPEALVEQAADDGLLLDAAHTAGLRRCAACHPHAAAPLARAA